VKKRRLSIEYPLNKKIPAWAAAANRRTRNICREVREGARFRRGSIYHEVNHELHLPTENKNARERFLTFVRNDNACHLEPFEEDTQGKLRERSFFNPIFKGAHEGHEVRERGWFNFFSYLRDLRALRGESLFPHFAPWQEIPSIATILH
jgi:hypothetical protein